MNVYEFVLQAFGFFIQTISVVSLLCVPFEDGSLKYSRKKVMCMLILPELFMSLGFAVFETIVSGSRYINMMSNLYMIVYIVISVILFIKLIETHVLNKLLVLIILIHYAAIIFTINNIVQTLMDIQNLAYELKVYDTETVIIFLISTVFTLPVIYIFLLRAVRPVLSVMDNKSMKHGCVYMFLSLLLYCLVMMFFDFSFSRSDFRNIGIIMLFSAFIINDGIMYFMFFSETKLAVQNTSLKNQIKNFDEQYRQISMNIETARRARHDIRHHLSAISTMNKKGNSKAIDEYLDAYIKEFNDIENVALSGYYALDNILRYYIGVAKDSGIKVKTEFYPVNSSAGFNVTDITVLMGNIMENAVEACEQMPDGSEKFIDIWIKQKDASLLIHVKNSCRKELETKSIFSGNGTFLSTKHSKQNGQGIKSINLAVEKYDGNAEFIRENGSFTARIVLRIP